MCTWRKSDCRGYEERVCNSTPEQVAAMPRMGMSGGREEARTTVEPHKYLPELKFYSGSP